MPSRSPLASRFGASSKAAVIALACLPVACSPLPVPPRPQPAPVTSPTLPPTPFPWLKGQLHLHTDGSGDSQTPADSVVAWYEKRGFDFIVITDHNVVTEAASTPSLLVFPGVEITQNFSSCVPPEDHLPCRIHVNALFVDAEPGRIGGLLSSPGDAPDRIERYEAAIDLAHSLHGIAQINHPNFRFSATLPVLRAVLRSRHALLEIANEAVDSNNPGDAAHPSTEALWDELWSEGYTVWGTASDDAHHYDDAAELQAEGEQVFVGNRGWVMVHAPRAPDAIRAAIARGDFYSSGASSTHGPHVVDAQDSTTAFPPCTRASVLRKGSFLALLPRSATPAG